LFFPLSVCLFFEFDLREAFSAAMAAPIDFPFDRSLANLELRSDCLPPPHPRLSGSGHPPHYPKVDSFAVSVHFLICYELLFTLSYPVVSPLLVSFEDSLFI